MKKFFNRALLACSLLLTGGAASAQGLQGVVVEEYYTITAADSTFIADAGVVSEAPPVGAKVYRVFVDMLPNYKFLTVTGGPAAQGNTLDFTTTTKFWNQDALADQHAGNTRFLFQNGQAFDSFITIHTTGKANGTSANCAAFGGGTGSFNQQVGVLKTADTNANLTLCQAYTGFPTGSNDGNIPAPFTIGTAFSGFFTTTDFDALTTNTNTGSWTMVDDGYAITPPVTGVDPAGTNRVLIGQFTTDGQFSFHINVAIQNPQGVDEYYTWTNPNTGIGEQVSSFLTYPQVLPPDCNGVPGGPAVPGSPCNDLNACTTNDLWNASCQCVGTDISQTFTSSASACDTYTWAQNGQTYTASGTYTATAGCDTYVLNLTITPSTSNTTTASACDTYTWSVNGQTYTTSGTYTSVTGCNTEILNLTITPSTSNTTTASACDSYTWSVNGQTYTASGTYTSVTGCSTEILNLTITPSTSNTTTASACDTYTWSVNGQTYTASGSYTSVSGCNTEILNLTITPSTSNTTTASACDSYTWSVNGQTYTASGTYTSVTGCNTEILNLTILTSGTNTTTASACDIYTWSVNGQTYTASGTYTSVTGCSTEILNLTITPSTSNTTTASACDTYTWSVNGQTYTASGTYTSVTGCSTEILNLTITPSTSNTTTASACDTYTWSVNGQTYTASGTYTSVTGCNTEILNLTILTSGTNTTTASACDTYTWSVNGQTYTASGTYTSVTGCSTEILNLTITPSTSNTTTASACDTYTWSVNGQTYTASGTYTSVTGCNTEILNLTILTSGTNTTTASACDTYTWSVNGQTYTASGTYTAVTGCSTEILNLTITPSSSQSESATQCGTSYVWAVNGQSYNQSGTFTATIACVTYTLNLTLNVPGTPCDDGNNNTINDQLDLNCNCVGTPVGPGCDFNEVELVVVNDAVSLVSYEVRVQGTNVLTASGSVNPATGLTVQDICLPDGCYYLVVSDNGGDGIVGGGYVLRLAAGGRLIDNTGNMTVSPSQIAANEGFCLPLGADRLIATSCDKLDWRTVPCVPEYVVANANALVSAQYGVTNSTSGYQMWWYDPNGGYSFKRFQSHNTTNGLVASATRACHFKINAWTGNQLQEGVLYNVKVRGRVAGTYNAWGAACRFSLNNAAAQCPQARLNDIAGNQFFSCGVTRPVAANAYVYSTVVRRMQANCNWLNANRYQFRFRIPAEGFELVKTSSTWSVNTIGLACDKTYEVDVRASFDNGASWCATGDPYGTVCTVTTTACSSSMTQETTGGTAVEARISMYPNPNRGDQVFLSIGSIEEGVETVSVDIYDAFGKRVSARTIAAQDGFVNSVVELNGELSAGFYLVNVTAGSVSWSERLVVQP